MSFGLDYVAGPPVSDLKAAGVTFVCRYLSEVNDLTKVKLLTPEEAALLGENGIAIVSNFEWYGNRAAEGFASGVMDAQIADTQHKACGGPPDRPIYFSVDFNTGATAEIIDYFKGVASVIGLERTGAYGGYECVKGLLDAGAITWAWQTYAWSNGQWDERAHLQQYQNGVMLAGHEVDYNRSSSNDFGQWIFGGNTMGIPRGWRDDGITLTAPNGHFLQHGFRQHVLDVPTWDPGNQPNEEEYHADRVLLHNPGVGAGQRVTLRDCMFWYTPQNGVVQEPYSGLEIKACYDLIASQAAEIAALKAQPPIQIDTTALVAAINTIADNTAKDVALALAEAKKL